MRYAILLRKGGRLVDQEARNRAAQALRGLLTGALTNDEFEDAYPDVTETADRAIAAIHSMTWNAFSDTRVHRLVGSDKPDAATANRLERCVRFLQTNEEYRWSCSDFSRGGHVSSLVNAISFGLLRWLLDREMSLAGKDMRAAADSTEWPFAEKGASEWASSPIR